MSSPISSPISPRLSSATTLHADSAGPAAPGLDLVLACSLMVLSLAWSLLPAGLSWNLTNQSENLQGGNWVIQLQWGSLFLVAGLIALRHFEKFQEVLLGLNPFLVAFFLYTVANTGWSILPLVTLKKVIQLGGVILIATVFQVTDLSSTRWRKLMFATLLLLQILSVVMVVVLPDLGIEYANIEDGAWQGGAWRGVTDQKNSFGVMTAFAAIALVSLFWSPGVRLGWPTFLLLLGFCLLNVVMSKSTTSLLVTVMGSGCYLFFRRKYIDNEFVTSRVLLVIAFLLLIYLHVLFVIQGRFPTWDEFFKPVATLLGKSTDISGRFQIWDMVLDEISHHPWLGIGFGAFWLGQGSASQPIIDKMYWTPFQSHNGYLDLLNELGAVGLVLFAGFILYHLITLYRLSRYDASEAAFHGTLIVVTLVHNFTESSFFRGVNFLAVMVIYSSVTVSVSLRRYRLKAEGAARQAQYSR